MAVKFLRRGKIPTIKDKQKEVNIFFMETVKALYDDIVDEAFKMCYERYGLYPNVYTLKIMRQQLKNDIKLDVSIKDADRFNIPSD